MKALSSPKNLLHNVQRWKKIGKRMFIVCATDFDAFRCNIKRLWNACEKARVKWLVSRKIAWRGCVVCTMTVARSPFDATINRAVPGIWRSGFAKRFINNSWKKTGSCYNQRHNRKRVEVCWKNSTTKGKVTKRNSSAKNRNKLLVDSHDFQPTIRQYCYPQF